MTDDLERVWSTATAAAIRAAMARVPASPDGVRHLLPGDSTYADYLEDQP
jgi:hypothetical protein